MFACDVGLPGWIVAQIAAASLSATTLLVLPLAIGAFNWSYRRGRQDVIRGVSAWTRGAGCLFDERQGGCARCWSLLWSRRQRIDGMRRRSERLPAQFAVRQNRAAVASPRTGGAFRRFAAGGRFRVFLAQRSGSNDHAAKNEN